MPGEGADYRRARDGLLDAGAALRRQIEEVAALRRRLPLGGAVPIDYEFQERDGPACAAGTMRLSELFEDGKDTLFAYSFMVNPRPDRAPVGSCLPHVHVDARWSGR